jgi:hypothetical protein
MSKAKIQLLTAAFAVIACWSILLAQNDPGVLDSSQAVPYFIEDGTGVPGYRPEDRELARMAFDAWSRETTGRLRFTEARTRSEALVLLEWANAQTGAFGVTQRVEVRGKPGAVVVVMPDVRQLGEPLATRATGDALLRETIVYLTCVHEIGHAAGMPHTRNFDDIMYSFGYGGDIVNYFSRYRARLKTREDIARNSGLSAGDVAFLRRLYPAQ